MVVTVTLSDLMSHNNMMRRGGSCVVKMWKIPGKGLTWLGPGRAGSVRDSAVRGRRVGAGGRPDHTNTFTRWSPAQRKQSWAFPELLHCQYLHSTSSRLPQLQIVIEVKDNYQFVVSSRDSQEDLSRPVSGSSNSWRHFHQGMNISHLTLYIFHSVNIFICHQS